MKKIFCVLCLCLVSVSFAEEKPDKYDWLIKHPTILRLLELHNAERIRVGLNPLTLNTQMCLEAQNHATYMADSGWMVHSGLPYRENIFMWVRQPEDAVNGWIYSPAHYANMTSGATEIGLGYQYKNGRPCWVGVFK